MIIRCVLDGLLLPASFEGRLSELRAWDDDESFAIDAIEAHFYEVVEASSLELFQLERSRYRLLRPSWDFEAVAR